MAFTLQTKRTNSETLIALEGALDEQAELSKVQPCPLLKIDLEKLVYINSIGIRKWIRWMQDVATLPQIEILHCPVIFVKNLSSIRGMVGANTRVESFYVPYYSEASGERRNVLFRRGIEFLDDGTIKVADTLTLENEVLEIDVVEDIYFSFLRK